MMLWKCVGIVLGSILIMFGKCVGDAFMDYVENNVRVFTCNHICLITLCVVSVFLIFDVYMV